MTSRFTELAVDCHDPERLAAFWCEILDFEVIDWSKGKGKGKGKGKVETGSWVPTVEDVRARQMSPTPLSIQVPEGKTVKNRLHLDISPIDGSTGSEVTRLLGLGATKTDVGQGPDRNWVVMADPEDNEFCVLHTLAPQNQVASGHPHPVTHRNRHVAEKTSLTCKIHLASEGGRRFLAFLITPGQWEGVTPHSRFRPLTASACHARKADVRVPGLITSAVTRRTLPAVIVAICASARSSTPFRSRWASGSTASAVAARAACQGFRQAGLQTT